MLYDMAEKKKAARKAPKKATSKADAAPAKKPAKKAPAEPSRQEKYEALVSARRAMNASHAAVLTAERAVKSAYAHQGDFGERDRRVAAAQEKLTEARLAAAEATDLFQSMKYGG